jgi:hypothetical protein
VRALALHLVLALTALSLACGTGGDDGVQPEPTPGGVGTPDTGTSGSGISIQAALDSGLTGPLLVDGFVLASGRQVRLCDALAESFPPQCGEPSLGVEGLDLSTLPDARSSAGVTWTDSPVQILGMLSVDILTAESVRPETPPGSLTPLPRPTVAGPAASPPTGIVEVDAVIAAVLDGDTRALARLVVLQSAECMSPDVQGLGGPPRCEPGESPGTRVEAFPASQCEGFFVRDPAPVLQQFVSQAVGLHSVVRAPAEPRSEPYWPVGEYWVNFTAEFVPQTTGARLVLEDGALVLAFFGCGHTPESLMEHRGRALPVVLPPAD